MNEQERAVISAAIEWQRSREYWSHNWGSERARYRGDITTQQLAFAVQRLRNSRSAKPLPSTESLTGSDPNFTGGLTTEEYLDRIRGKQRAYLQGREMQRTTSATASARERPDLVLTEYPITIEPIRDGDGTWHWWMITVGDYMPAGTACGLPGAAFMTAEINDNPMDTYVLDDWCTDCMGLLGGRARPGR